MPQYLSGVSSIFSLYRDSIFSIQNDITFWKSFLEWSIAKYVEEHPEKKNELFTSIFHVYDLPSNSDEGYLKTFEKIFSIFPFDLEKHRKAFFNLIMNLSIVKIYSALELLLLQSIQRNYFSQYGDPVLGKVHMDKISAEIKVYLKSNNIYKGSKNNRDIIQFLKLKSVKFSEFVSRPIRKNFVTNWQNLFELVSILRNIIAHHSLIVTKDAMNEIKSKAKDIFETFFTLLEDENGNQILYPKDGDDFSNFINLLNDFGVNSAKFIFGEDDLSFLDLK